MNQVVRNPFPTDKSSRQTAGGIEIVHDVLDINIFLRQQSIQDFAGFFQSYDFGSPDIEHYHRFGMRDLLCARLISLSERLQHIDIELDGVVHLHIFDHQPPQVHPLPSARQNQMPPSAPGLPALIELERTADGISQTHVWCPIEIRDARRNDERRHEWMSSAT